MYMFLDFAFTGSLIRTESYSKELPEGISNEIAPAEEAWTIGKTVAFWQETGMAIGLALELLLLERRIQEYDIGIFQRGWRSGRGEVYSNCLGAIQTLSASVMLFL